MMDSFDKKLGGLKLPHTQDDSDSDSDEDKNDFWH